MNRSTFLGLNMETAIALSMSNFAGAQLDNTAGFKLETVAAAGIEQKTSSFRQSSLACFTPGAAGPAAGGGAAFAAGLGAVVGVLSGGADIKSTLDQYAKAAAQLRKAADDASHLEPPVPGLERRLLALASATDKRYGEAAAGLLTAGVGILVESGLDAVGGPGAATDVDGLSDAPGKDD